MNLARWILALACAMPILAACGEGAAPSKTTYIAPTPVVAATRSPLPAPVVIANALVPPAGSVYFGAYVDTSGLLGGATPADTLQFESTLGRTLALHMEYQSWSVIFDGPQLQADFNSYLVPVVSWNCGVPDGAIIAGTYDPTIKLKADEIKAYGWPVFLRFFWDPNLPDTMLNRSDCSDGTPTGDFAPALYVKAWKHVRQIFTQEGATNVVWVWTYSTNPNGVSPAQYYPGADEVDWVGVDDYDLQNASFQATFSSSNAYPSLTQYGKPIMISETGASAATQPSFFSGAASTLQSNFPQIQAFLYYDGIDYVTGQNQDWRVTSGAFSQFITFSNAPYMAASYGH